ncbi:MAG TPA: beta-ketoacyl synthase N-terminal-like domain-containing protein [Terracidiphilus sp.]|nr:beta-ketoacyl synthase N-terminal-like domain-containing protein [Terracidiphilus sp.]
MSDTATPQLKRALAALEKMQTRLEAAEHRGSEPIAVVGMGCRFPGAENPDEFWRLLSEGRDATAEAPAGRDSRLGRGGFLRKIEEFDHEFFHVTPREATAMDPQQRVLLEVAWEALEDACIPGTSLFATNTGVYVGACSFDFALWRSRRMDEGHTDSHFATGAALSVAAGRLSYFLGLNGPAITVDTACSSSLVAVHHACAALRAGECEAAIAGGVSLLLAPEYSVNFRKAGMLASDGHCKTFDAAADGFARAEGCGLVVLKRLSDALHAGDRVRALILGSAVNQDGASGGLTVPSGPSQEAVIRKALRNARRTPGQIDYIEAHGTGTSLGDPIEVQAVNEVFTGRDRPLAIGSVKTNIGHCEAAAGVAGLIKTILAIEEGALPRHLHFERANPNLDLTRLPLRVVTEPQAWPSRPGEPRRAGVSAFGFSGTNANVIVEQAPAAEVQDTDPRQLPFVLSAASDKALRAMAGNWAAWLKGNDGVPLADICAAAFWGRSRLECSLGLKSESVQVLIEELHRFAETGTAAPGVRVNVPAHEPAHRPWRRLSMPLYPFQRTRHWLEGPATKTLRIEGDFRAWLAGELAEIIGEIDATQIDTRRGFADLGLDSIMAAQLAEAIERELGIDVPVMTVFNYPTLQDLAAHCEAIREGEAYARN